MNKKLEQSYKRNAFGYKTESEKFYFTLEKGIISGVPKYKNGWKIIIRNKKNNQHVINLEAETLKVAKHKVSIFIKDN